MKKIEKTISRDLPLINMYAWHRGYTVGMKKWLGWSYSDALFYAHDGYVDIMRASEEHMADFKNVVISKIKSDRKWFENEQEVFLAQTNEIYSFYDAWNSETNERSAEEALDTYHRYISLVENIIGPYITFLWLPIWMEKDRKLKKQFEHEYEIAVNARKYSEQIFPRGDKLALEILENINQTLKLERSLLKLVSFEEFQAYVKETKRPNLETLRKRAEGFIFSHQGIHIVGNRPENIKNGFAEIGYLYESENHSHMTEVKGAVAYRGNARGVVQLVMTKDLIAEFKEGSVLVASMTTPEYVPAMKKASAVVTDEGGVTCHAAIIARELGKPCIIGTKIATKVLKDGDIVEVDANSGVVKIIN